MSKRIYEPGDFVVIFLWDEYKCCGRVTDFPNGTRRIVWDDNSVSDDLSKMNYDPEYSSWTNLGNLNEQQEFAFKLKNS